MAKRRRQPAKPKRGRPELPASERRGYRVMVRMSNADGQGLEELARIRESTPSTVCRDVLRKELKACGIID